MAEGKKPRYVKVLPSNEELRSQTGLTVPEAMKLTGYSRDEVIRICDEGLVRSANVGQGTKRTRRRIETDSLLQYERDLYQKVAS